MADLPAAEYFFLEWLILGKRMTQEQFSGLSAHELCKLKLEYVQFQKTLNPADQEPGQG